MTRDTSDMSSDNNFANLSHVAAFILLSFNNLVNLCKISREYLQRYHQLVGASDAYHV